MMKLLTCWAFYDVCERHASACSCGTTRKKRIALLKGLIAAMQADGDELLNRNQERNNSCYKPLKR
ncbi:hypothetical protein OK016_12725 [Vibrio chagasii]|nr:hypothetical protein [Vibrio chagasii]